METRTNKLAQEKSPYLLQHKNNPVDWYPWGEEAFEKARKEDKPIFLSVGYSTCHWCHVMAHESFENEQIAEYMNSNFVNIKIDREERPDIDKIYMTFVQAITGGGGWPMSVWLTPDLKPIYGGTYYPVDDHYGRPGFLSILKLISDNWKNNRTELIEQGDRIINALKESTSESSSSDYQVTMEPINTCYRQIERSYDSEFGGFTRAPKFPRPVIFQLLFDIASQNNENSKKALEMSLFTLKKMAMGGMFDHLDGGFHRYSTTRDWHIPHFEKMLYDQSQLVNSYLTAYQFTNDNFYLTTAKYTLDYVINRMTSKEGGFYSAEDADSIISFDDPSKHAEGAFYVWDYDEIISILGSEHANVFNFHFGVKKGGNVPASADPHGELTGKNHLQIVNPIDDTATMFNLSIDQVKEIIESSKKKLNEKRSSRPRPHLDDKIITSWNGLMISAFSRGYRITHDDRYLQAAISSARFIRDKLWDENGKYLIRNYRNGPSNIKGFADDYAFLINGLLDLYESCFDIEWLKWANELQDIQNDLFWDDSNGGYFSVQEGDKNLILRMKEEYDGAEPSNNSVSAINLLRLSQMIGRSDYRDYATGIFSSFSQQLKNAPIAMPLMCCGISISLSPIKQVVIVGDGKDIEKSSSDNDTMINEIYKLPISTLYHLIILLINNDSSHSYLSSNLEYLKDMKMIDNKTTAYICQNFTCQLPVNNLYDLVNSLSPHRK